MSMKLNHDRDDGVRETGIQDPIHDMPEPPGALGDIVRRMKRAPSLPPRMIPMLTSSAEAHDK